MPPLLRRLAHRVRDHRRQLGLTRSELARRSGLSERFLARVEAGEGNISILRLEALAGALQTTTDRLLRNDADDSSLIVLVGLRGAGKSTIGPLLGRRLGLRFIEADGLIAESAGLPIAQLFELHGERYYRRLELEILRGLLARAEPAVVAVAGGVINDPVTWRMLCEQARVVWLHASAEDHWNRVLSQGDERPMADNPIAMEELRAMLDARREIYAEASIDIDTSTLAPQQIAERIEGRLMASRQER